MNTKLAKQCTCLNCALPGVVDTRKDIISLSPRAPATRRGAPGGILIFYALVTFAIFLQLADYVLTVWTIGPGVIEANPLLAPLFEGDNHWLTILFPKVSFALLAGILGYCFIRFVDNWKTEAIRLRIMLFMLGGFNLIYTFVVGNNIAVYIQVI